MDPDHRWHLIEIVNAPFNKIQKLNRGYSKENTIFVWQFYKNLKNLPERDTPQKEIDSNDDTEGSQ